SYFFTASVTSGEQAVSSLFTIEVVGPSPPFSGTIFIDPDIITDEDPTTFVGLLYTGQGARTMFDRRADTWITVDAYLFVATWADGLQAEVQVNPEFASRDAAEVEAEVYATAVGRLPVALLQDVETLWIHRGVYPFGGGNKNILIHTGQGEQYAADGILEETLVHEAAHTSLDPYHGSAADWRRAQVADGTFISTYARDFPTREDVAESYLPYLAVRHRPSRISSSLAETILETMPFRIEYFDSLALEVFPIG
ncbi:MAG: hypothetical protein HKN73_08865, partial [Gemmatimonadetes bacterium]|nr:hypothetical protein [Gemmatimonadota bacterium]